MKRILSAIVLMLGASTVSAQEVAQDTVKAIQEMLATMQCEMDPDEIEPTESGGYELDDVFCADGQYDIELDAGLAVIEKRKE